MWVEALDGQRCNPNATSPADGFVCPDGLKCQYNEVRLEQRDACRRAPI